MKKGEKGQKIGDVQSLKQQIEKGVENLLELHKVQSSLIFDLKEKISSLRNEKSH